jgi:regulatory protein
MREREESKWLQRMAGYCSLAERCEEQIRGKLARGGLSQEVIQRIIDRLTEEKFIDQGRYCRSFVNDKLRLNRWGRVRIATELRQRELPSVLIAEAIATIDLEEYREILDSLLIEKSKSVQSKDLRERYYKLLRYVVARGFEPSVAVERLRRLEFGEGEVDGEGVVE